MSTVEAASGEWHIPGNIHTLFHDGGVIYLNTESGNWGVTNRQVGIVMLEGCGVLGDMDLAWRELKSWRPAPSDFMTVANVGLLAPNEPGQDVVPRQYKYAKPPKDVELLEAGNILMTRALTDPTAPLAPQVEADAYESITEAIDLIHKQPFPVYIERMREARGSDIVPATMAQALEVAGVIRQVSDPYPHKVACLEHSTATALLGARLGLQIEVELGAGVDPIGYHAWPVAEGEPVRLEYDEPVLGRYYPVFSM